MTQTIEQPMFTIRFIFPNQPEQEYNFMSSEVKKAYTNVTYIFFQLKAKTGRNACEGHRRKAEAYPQPTAPDEIDFKTYKINDFRRDMDKLSQELREYFGSEPAVFQIQIV